jgi:septal ring factor EnvC (AmiA/AmiB activator)
MTMSPEDLKKNFDDQLAQTEKQIAELEASLAKAREYKTKLQGGLETLSLLNGETPGEAPAEETPTEVVAE